MTVSTIDGTLTAAEIKWSRRGKSYFSLLAFQKADGSVEERKKVVVADSVAPQLVAGTSGRFYLFKSMGVMGLHGVRFADGREAHEYPGDQAMIFAMMSIVWVILNILYVTTKDQISILGLILTPVGIFGWYWCRKVRGEVQQLWDNDPDLSGATPTRTVASIVAN